MSQQPGLGQNEAGARNYNCISQRMTEIQILQPLAGSCVKNRVTGTQTWTLIWDASDTGTVRATMLALALSDTTN